MLPKSFSNGDVLTFDNGMIGCVTERGFISIVDKSGWKTTPENMPRMADYVKLHQVVHVEYAELRQEDLAA